MLAPPEHKRILVILYGGRESGKDFFIRQCQQSSRCEIPLGDRRTLMDSLRDPDQPTAEEETCANMGIPRTVFLENPEGPYLSRNACIENTTNIYPKYVVVTRTTMMNAAFAVGHTSPARYEKWVRNMICYNPCFRIYGRIVMAHFHRPECTMTIHPRCILRTSLCGTHNALFMQNLKLTKGAVEDIRCDERWSLRHAVILRGIYPLPDFVGPVHNESYLTWSIKNQHIHLARTRLRMRALDHWLHAFARIRWYNRLYRVIKRSRHRQLLLVLRLLNANGIFEFELCRYICTEAHLV
jgi:hypothetical protein